MRGGSSLLDARCLGFLSRLYKSHPRPPSANGCHTLPQAHHVSHLPVQSSLLHTARPDTDKSAASNPTSNQQGYSHDPHQTPSSSHDAAGLAASDISSPLVRSVQPNSVSHSASLSAISSARLQSPDSWMYSRHGLKPLSRAGKSLIMHRNLDQLQRNPPTIPKLPPRVRIVKQDNGKIKVLRPNWTRSAFQLFMNQQHYDVREQAVRKHPTFTEISKSWRMLDAATRQPFDERAAALKSQALSDWNLEHPPVKKEELQMAPDLAEAVAALPQHPKTGYHVYLQAVSLQARDSDTPMAFGDGVRAASAKWKLMSVEQKQPYLDTAIRDKQELLDRRKQLNARLKAAGHEVIPQKDPKARRPLSPSNLYVKEHFVAYSKQHPTERLQIVMKNVLGAYTALPPEQKEPYIQEAARLAVIMAGERQAAQAAEQVKPGHRRRSAGPYQRFFKKMYHGVATSMPPGSIINDIARVLDRMWHELSDEQRKVYTDAYLQQRDDILLEAHREKPQPLKLRRVVGPAQRYLTAMYHEVAKQMPPGGVWTDTIKVVRKNWKMLPVEERQKYYDATDEDKAQRVILLKSMEESNKQQTQAST